MTNMGMQPMTPTSERVVSEDLVDKALEGDLSPALMIFLNLSLVEELAGEIRMRLNEGMISSIEWI